MTNQSDGDATAPPAAGGILLSTHQVEAGQRIDFWREANRLVFDVRPIFPAQGTDLAGSIHSWTLGSLLISATSFSGQYFSRDRRVIARSGLDQYLVQLCTGGTMRGDFDGTPVAVKPGDVFVLDLAHTVNNRAEAGERIIFLVPRAALDKATGHRHLHGRVLAAERPTTQLIATYMRALRDIAAGAPEPEAAAIEEALLLLLGAALRGDDPAEAERQAMPATVLRRRVLDFIAQNLHRPELSPDLILSRFNVSRAHLYRAFAADGGVATVIRERRLDAAFVALTRSTAAGRSITDIAYELGFPSNNQLLRNFRDRFGITPSQARQDRPGAWQAPDLQTYYLELSRRIRQAETQRRHK
jgi:AraC-like DNA-binding protein